MKKLLCLAVTILLAACSSQPDPQDVVVRVNDYKLTYQEFQQEFDLSPFAARPSNQAKEQFIESLIDRKLILQDAQLKGLDKDPEFLKSIERFWEQSLLKVALDKKAKDLVGSVQATEDEINGLYNQLAAKGEKRPLSEIYPQVKWKVSKQKEMEALNEWMNHLKSEAKVKVSDKLLSNK